VKHGRQIRGVNPDVLEMFAGYSWPGNVRELRNVLERAAIVSNRDLIGRAHLPEDFGRAFTASALPIWPRSAFPRAPRLKRSSAR
jgi:transcriptional regulator with PAS, ATPase and Fis domain